MSQGGKKVHKDDQMTPLERKDALARGEQVDRMPISIFYGAPAHHLLGWTRPQSVALSLIHIFNGPNESLVSVANF